MKIRTIIGAFALALTSQYSAAQGEPEIPGYAYGGPQLETSPVSLEDLDLLKKTVFFGDEDVKALRMAQEVLKPQINEILDLWYGYVGANEHLLYYFTNKDSGAPIGEYLDRVRARFGQWILDTTSANYDQRWLDWQYEIAKRHHRVGKNKTDNAASVDHINYRYMIAFNYPISLTIKSFLEKGDHTEEEVNAMHQAWTKSVLIQTILWTYPYVKEGDF